MSLWSPPNGEGRPPRGDDAQALTLSDLVQEAVELGGAALPGELCCLRHSALDERGA